LNLDVRILIDCTYIHILMECVWVFDRFHTLTCMLTYKYWHIYMRIWIECVLAFNRCHSRWNYRSLSQNIVSFIGLFCKVVLLCVFWMCLRIQQMSFEFRYAFSDWMYIVCVFWWNVSYYLIDLIHSRVFWLTYIDVHVCIFGSNVSEHLTVYIRVSLCVFWLNVHICVFWSKVSQYLIAFIHLCLI